MLLLADPRGQIGCGNDDKTVDTAERVVQSGRGAEVSRAGVDSFELVEFGGIPRDSHDVCSISTGKGVANEGGAQLSACACDSKFHTDYHLVYDDDSAASGRGDIGCDGDELRPHA